jgi:hypothetical protein
VRTDAEDALRRALRVYEQTYGRDDSRLAAPRLARAATILVPSVGCALATSTIAASPGRPAPGPPGPAADGRRRIGR